MVKALVLLATYNGEKYLKDQLDSILNQNDIDIHILVGDDNSTDRTMEILKDYESKCKKLTITSNKPGLGCAANFLDLTIKSKSFSEFNYFAFADQDDVWLPDKLKIAIDNLKINNADLYHSNLLKWEYRDNKFSLLKKSYKQTEFDYLFEGGSAGCTYVFTEKLRDLISNHIITFDSRIYKSFSHDWYFYFFARINNLKVFSDSKAYIMYRIHGNNLHGHMNSVSFNAIKKRIDHLRSGWYFKHIDYLEKMLLENSVQKRIYSKYNKSLFSRMSIVFCYNFKLMRSKRKFILFIIASLISKK